MMYSEGNMKKKIWIILLAAVLVMAGVLQSCNTKTNTEDPDEVIMTSGSEGYFNTAFCREINQDGPVQWTDGTQLFYSFLSADAKAVLDAVQTVGDIYEYATLTFYPNGVMKQTYRIKDTIYEAFAENETVASYVPQEMDTQTTYIVDDKQKKITIGDGTTITYDSEKGALYKDNLCKAECYENPAEVVGDGSGLEVDYTLMPNISYGSDERHTMDVFLPKALDATKDNGAFILIYGGSWTGGDKESNWALAKQYASAGFVSVAINMRNCYVDETAGKTVISIYDMLNDVQGSVKKLKDLSDENSWNITQCAMKGFSSGGNIALLYAYSRDTDVPYFDTETILPVRFVADVVGPVDMHDSAWYGDEEWPEADRTMMTAQGAGPLYAILITGMGNKGGVEELSETEIEEAINSMSPVWYVENFGGLPSVLGYSARDIIQNPNNGKRLKGYLDAKGVRCDLYTFENSVHGYSDDPQTAQEYFNKTIEYANTYFVPTGNLHEAE